eukprot:m.537900 g.537900  ORF g.537900 m.537900 type:complete len:188 (+) comp22077_c0_seq45:3960-4523(+)
MGIIVIVIVILAESNGNQSRWSWGWTPSHTLLNCRATRMQIADFGNSRLMRGYREHYAKQSTAPTNNNAHAQTSAVTESVGVTALDMNDYTRATMTKGTGTLLWMAPELFSLGKIQYGTAIDVYSYAVVLFEIWTRQDPWLHIGATDYLDFCTALEKAVLSGYAAPRVCCGQLWQVLFWLLYVLFGW